jgi:hypothetical protein
LELTHYQSQEIRFDFSKTTTLFFQKHCEHRA